MMRPSSVSAPAATTTLVARPDITMGRRNVMLWRSHTVAFAGPGSVDLPALAQSQGGSSGKLAPGMQRSASGPAYHAGRGSDRQFPGENAPRQHRDRHVVSDTINAAQPVEHLDLDAVFE
jgi:hypothetical protein